LSLLFLFFPSDARRRFCSTIVSSGLGTTLYKFVGRFLRQEEIIKKSVFKGAAWLIGLERVSSAEGRFGNVREGTYVGRIGTASFPRLKVDLADVDGAPITESLKHCHRCRVPHYLPCRQFRNHCAKKKKRRAQKAIPFDT
jgi:hypothetical protein